jgi:transcriptional regulator with XRE-family HTH domain
MKHLLAADSEAMNFCDSRSGCQAIDASAGKLVRTIRELQKFSRSALAQLTGIPKSAIAAIENDCIKLDVERAKAMARALHVHPAVLLFPGWDVERESAACHRPRKASQQAHRCALCNKAKRDGASPNCLTCRRLVAQARNAVGRRAKWAVVKAAQAKRAIRASLLLGQQLYDSSQPIYACYYSGIPLCVDRSYFSQGDYVSFDHTVPSVTSKVVLCSRLVNNFKGPLAEGEFRKFVCGTLDITVPRRLHGLTVEETEEYLLALRAVFQKAYKCSEARQQLKLLSAKVCFGKKQVITPGE